MLKIFGKTVLNYFLTNFTNAHPFKLSIDDYTFSNIVKISGGDEETIIKRIQSKTTYFSCEYEALAIAAYQVKIAGDIAPILGSGSDGYYQKIRDNYSRFKKSDNNEIRKEYFYNQDNL